MLSCDVGVVFQEYITRNQFIPYLGDLHLVAQVMPVSDYWKF